MMKNIPENENRRPQLIETPNKFAANSWHAGCTDDLEYPVNEKHPINCISWLGLRDLCLWLGGDLPTEAQWERAARNGHDGLNDTYWLYPWGNELAGCDRCIMANDIPGCGRYSTAPVASLYAHPSGLYDMSGNVSEWVLDWYHYPYEEGISGLDPTGPTGDYSFLKVTRGNDYRDRNGHYSRPFWVAHRISGKYNGDGGASVHGGRCARLVKDLSEPDT
ncbi:MAG: formylglycine-generating enzyme family protein [Deltaproteobacteria bacterium]|nr:formylglycine-generating enzyme family protein [Deltaproteobacteria bacterium]